MSDIPTIFADAMLDASLLHGVLRVRLGQVAGGGNALVPAGQLVMPLDEMRGLLAALNNVVAEAEARLRAPAIPMPAGDSIGGAVVPARPRARPYSGGVAARGRSISHPPPSAL